LGGGSELLDGRIFEQIDKNLNDTKTCVKIATARYPNEDLDGLIPTKFDTPLAKKAI